MNSFVPQIVTGRVSEKLESSEPNLTNRFEFVVSLISHAVVGDVREVVDETVRDAPRGQSRAALMYPNAPQASLCQLGFGVHPL